MNTLNLPLVSIITPTFNREQYIVKTIESVLTQDYHNIEYIIIDDGSSDSTSEIISSYRDKIQYIRHDNIGETRTVNKGYALAKGEFVMVVNSDDPLYQKNAVSLLVKCLLDNPHSEAVYPDWVRIDQVGCIISKIIQPDYTLESMLIDFDVSIGPGMMIRKKALEALQYRNTELKYTGDLDLSFKLALRAPLCHVKELLATHREHTESLSSSAKGLAMAKEVLAVAVSTYKSPFLPSHIHQKKYRIYGSAYGSALRYLNKNEPHWYLFRFLSIYYKMISLFCQK